MKQYTEYEDSLVWELYDEIIIFLEDLRRIMFQKGLEDLNERSIQYFENVRRMFYDENKILDTEMVLTATAKWLVILYRCKPNYLATAQEYASTRLMANPISFDTENQSYYRLLLFIIRGNEEWAGSLSNKNNVDISEPKSDTSLSSDVLHEQSNGTNRINNVVNDIFGAIEKNVDPFNGVHKGTKILTSYEWQGKSEDLKELHSALRNYIKPCEFERFVCIFSKQLPHDFAQIEWIGNANELLYFITQMMNLGLIPMEDRIVYLRIDACFLLLERGPMGKKWRYQKQKLDGIKREKKDSLDAILKAFL